MAARANRLLLGSLLFASWLAASADPREFVPPPSLSPEQIEQMKEASKSNLGQYGKDVSAETEPFPWLAVLLCVLVVAGTAPFAWRAYKRMSEEIDESGPTATRKRSETLDE